MAALHPNVREVLRRTVDGLLQRARNAASLRDAGSARTLRGGAWLRESAGLENRIHDAVVATLSSVSVDLTKETLDDVMNIVDPLLANTERGVTREFGSAAASFQALRIRLLLALESTSLMVEARRHPSSCEAHAAAPAHATEPEGSAPAPQALEAENGPGEPRARAPGLESPVSRTEGRAARGHVVLLIHGIRTQAEWQHRAAAVLETEPTIRVRPTRYEFLDVVRFLLPFRGLRRRPVQRITALIRDELSRKPDRLSVVGHSFGTFIICKILDEEPDITFDRILLCGSIVPDSFPWERFGHRLAPNEQLDWQVVNDCGMSDPWPILAQSITWGYGSSGRFGFGHSRVKDRFHAVGHSGFFSEAFIRTYWLPYLTKGDVVAGEVDIPTTPWFLSVLTVLKLRWVLFGGLVLAMMGLGYLALRAAGLLPNPLS